MLKNKSLAIQIWLVFLSLILGVFLLLSIVFPLILKSFFTDDMYTNIEEVQKHFFEFQTNKHLMPPIIHPHIKDHDTDSDDVMFQNVVLFEKDPHMKSNSLINYKIIEKEALEQSQTSKRYSMNYGNKTLLYVINKRNGITLFTYVWSDFRNELVSHLMTRLLIIIAVVILISFPVSILFARRLSRPLIDISNHVKELSERKWNKTFLLNRTDEVGILALSVERLRKRLIKYDEKQQHFIQHVSHELKTPVMVIQSYLQSIEDGIYPKGDLNGSIAVLKEETSRLDKKVKDLLYLTKLNYFSEEKLECQLSSLDLLVDSVAEKFQFHRKELDFIIQTIPVSFECNEEQFSVVLENIIQNQIRYAKTKIEINLFQNEKEIILSISNDGNEIELEDPNQVFEPFFKGNDGHFGLGLAIVKSIIEKHNGVVEAKNLDNGVIFILKFLKQRK